MWGGWGRLWTWGFSGFVHLAGCKCGGEYYFRSVAPFVGCNNVFRKYLLFF